MLGELDLNLDKAKEIISIFLKVSCEDIDANTRIDNNAIKSSVLVHRMYSELAKNGFKVNNFYNLKTFGDLEKDLQGIEHDDSMVNVENPPLRYEYQDNSISSISIAIDIESSLNLPDAIDYFEEQFYKDNFSKSEIAYCSSKLDAKSCFAGRFAAKEAIVKANKRFINTKFSNIEVSVSENGQPIFDGMNISISHLKLDDVDFSAAIAQQLISYDISELEKKITQNSNLIKNLDEEIKSKKNTYVLLGFLFILSIILIIYGIF
jgi:holo-[acyl-carrier protein] synthase